MYRVFAMIICAAVAFQAAVIVWGFAGLGVWVEGGGVLDKAAMESEGPPPFPEVMGLMLHGQNGMMVIPIIALLFLIVSFFARAPHGRTLALVVVGLTALQIFLGLSLHSAPIAGLFHGINALLLFSTALLAFLMARTGLGPRHRGDEASTQDHRVGVEV
ncbi:hypothetical protein [Microlunatus soli]|uniref:hypothetical protein n=1 Tax=Microlunatus soli TaxID=630515 RepID=UPI000B8801A7|nr:hypothetical protein [Microlunatus soli]